MPHSPCHGGGSGLGGVQQDSRARRHSGYLGRAWEYYLEEPLVKNCVNSWRSFAVGNEVKVACDNDDMKEEATARI